MVQSVQMNISYWEWSEMVCFIAIAREYDITKFKKTARGGIEYNISTSDLYILFISQRHKYYKEKHRRYVSHY